MTTKSATVLFRCADGEEVEARRAFVESSCRVFAGMLEDACVDDSKSPTFDVSDFGKPTVEAFLGLASVMSFDGKGVVDFTMANVLRETKERDFFRTGCDKSPWHFDLALEVVEFATKYDAAGVLGFFRFSLSSWGCSDASCFAVRQNANSGKFSGNGCLVARLLIAVLKAGGGGDGDGDGIAWLPLRLVLLLVCCMLKSGKVCIPIVDVPVEIRECLFRRALQEWEIPEGQHSGYQKVISALKL